MKKDLYKILLYLAVSFFAAALISPLIFNWGKQLGEHVASNDCAAAIEWLGEKCEDTKFFRFFKRALLFSALVLIYPLVLWIKRGKEKGKRLPLGLKRPHAFRDAGLGMVFAVLSVVCILVVGDWLDYYVAKSGVNLPKLLLSLIVPVLLLSLVEELVFRGVIQRTLGQSLKLWPTILWTAFIYAFVHFAQPGRGGPQIEVASWDTGFEFLFNAAVVLFSVENLISGFCSLFVIGVIFSYTRWVTGSLWLGVGLHTGWVVMDKLFYKLYRLHPEMESFLIFGKTVKGGLFPLAVLICLLVAIVYLGKKYEGASLDK